MRCLQNNPVTVAIPQQLNGAGGWLQRVAGVVAATNSVEDYLQCILAGVGVAVAPAVRRVPLALADVGAQDKVPGDWMQAVQLGPNCPEGPQQYKQPREQGYCHLWHRAT